MSRKMCIVVTMSSSVDNWIKPFINDYLSNGFELTIICNATQEYSKAFINEYPGVNFVSYPFPRGFYFKATIKSIKFLNHFFKDNHFDLVQYSTPNASFYASCAAKKRKIKNRLYCQWGMAFMTARGIKRLILKKLEKITCKNSTIVEPDSFGNLNYCREHGFYTEKKSRVIWNGSAKGLDLEKFDIKKKEQYKQEIFQIYPKLKDKYVIGFVGRLGKDKGCNELFEAFKQIEAKIPNAFLLFVGPLEKQDTIKPELLSYFKNNGRIIKTDRVKNVEKYYSVFDLFVLPSYREGFGMSVVEAESFGVPVVVTKYPGPECGMVDNETGYSIDRFSADEIANKVVFLHDNQNTCAVFSNNAIKYAAENYDFNIFRKKYIGDRIQIIEGGEE